MSDEPKKILLVDDQPDFLSLASQILASLGGPGWEIHTADNVGQAMGIIQASEIDLVVLDIHMPVVDGLQFVNLLQRKHPGLLNVVLTGLVTEEHRALCLNRGAELYLQKPQSTDEWEILFNSLNELVRFKPQDGFRGVLRRVGLQDILQMECLSRNSALLEISTKEVRGLIYICQGEIVHSEVGERTGEEAFNYLMSLSGGAFKQNPYVEPPQRTISGSWEFLLMEAARHRDENAPEELGLSNDLPEPEPATDPIAHTQFFRRAPEPPPKPVLRPEVAEFVILSSQGDLLYDWQCPDVPGRVQFLEFISKRAGQLSQALTLGHFEAFEIHGNRSRVVTQIENDHAILVRTNLTPAA
jgi:CheY-like chemotaxis protein